MNVGPAKKWGRWSAWGEMRCVEARSNEGDLGESRYLQVRCVICGDDLTVGYPLVTHEANLFGRFIEDHVHTGQMMLPWGVR